MRGCFPWCCSNERLARAPPSLCQPLHQRLLRIGPAMIILRACLEFTTGEIIVGHFCTLPSFIGNPVLKKVGAIRQKGGHAPPRENDQNLRGAAGQSWSDFVRKIFASHICGVWTPEWTGGRQDHLLCLYLMTIPTNQRHKKISSRHEHPPVIFDHDHLFQLMINWWEMLQTLFGNLALRSNWK